MSKSVKYLNKVELMAKATELGISVNEKMTNAEMVSLITKALNSIVPVSNMNLTSYNVPNFEFIDVDYTNIEDAPEIPELPELDDIPELPNVEDNTSKASSKKSTGTGVFCCYEGCTEELTEKVLDFCNRKFPGKPAACFKHQRTLNYVTITTKKPNVKVVTNERFGVCSKCGRPFSVEEAKLNSVYANELGGKYCFAHANVEIVKEFRERFMNKTVSKKYNNSTTAPNTNTAASNTTSNDNVVNHSDNKNVIKCICHNSVLTPALVALNNDLQVIHPEYKGLYLCMSEIVKGGFMKEIAEYRNNK